MTKALILAAHLDDSVIALGGTIRKIVESGGRVDVVCFGHSDEDFADVADKEACIARSTAQARQAHQILGVTTFTCLDYPDFGVQENRETYRLCITSIRKYQPDIIFGHYWAEYFQHRAMARLACDSWWQAGWSCSADLGAPWIARALYHFEVLHPLPEPTDIVDISDTFETKMAAFGCFQSSPNQVKSESGDGGAVYHQYWGFTGGSQSEQLEARARHYGSMIGVRYGEAFKRSDFIPRAVEDISLL